MAQVLCTDRAASRTIQRLALLASCAFAAGALALSPAPAVAGCASGDDPNTPQLSSPNCRAAATDNGLAVGSLAAANAVNTTAVGSLATATGANSSAFGTSTLAQGANATAVGASAGGVAVAGATNVGASSGAGGAGVYSTAVGGGDNGDSSSRAQGSYSIAIGDGDGAAFQPTIGPTINLNGARATGFISIAFGPASQASGGGSMAFGLGSKATAADSTAFGEFSKANGANSVAMGLFSTASGISSLVLGPEARATKPRSVAIGSGSIANVADTVSVGTNAARRRLVNVANAVANSDAATLGQVKALVAASARAASDSADIRRELAELRTLVKQQQQEIAEFKRSDAMLTRAAP